MFQASLSCVAYHVHILILSESPTYLVSISSSLIHSFHQVGINFHAIPYIYLFKKRSSLRNPFRFNGNMDTVRLVEDVKNSDRIATVRIENASNLAANPLA
ncbi:hypothetical protein Tagg_1043 [Thermosphaera aggregans DSM 11486]|uniref:Uncharacterized protein n=1 Tax=Thermosphaera aggregans (strain DSM 11486 / M11TL) TaxID=633148 RepID=D5U2G2_THEAM|nr:hypothetical protein Tagg_1043 [Thermosphaera aggregans DSM 11486]